MILDAKGTSYLEDVVMFMFGKTIFLGYLNASMLINNVMFIKQCASLLTNFFYKCLLTNKSLKHKIRDSHDIVKLYFI